MFFFYSTPSSHSSTIVAGSLLMDLLYSFATHGWMDGWVVVVFTTREINKKLCIWLIPAQRHWLTELHCPFGRVLATSIPKLIPLCQRHHHIARMNHGTGREWKVIFPFINVSFVCTWQDANVELNFRAANYFSCVTAERITLFRLTELDGGWTDNGGGGVAVALSHEWIDGWVGEWVDNVEVVFAFYYFVYIFR